RKSGCGRALLVQALSDPDLDDGLARDPESPGLPIERVDHPRRKVDVDAAAFLSRTARSGKIESRGHVLALVEPRIELLSLHRGSPPLFATAAPRRVGRGPPERWVDGPAITVPRRASPARRRRAGGRRRHGTARPAPGRWPRRSRRPGMPDRAAAGARSRPLRSAASGPARAVPR